MLIRCKERRKLMQSYFGIKYILRYTVKWVFNQTINDHVLIIRKHFVNEKNYDDKSENLNSCNFHTQKIKLCF